MKIRRYLSIIALLSGLLWGQSAAEEVLTWQDCLGEAKKNHPDLISALNSVNAQQAQKNITASALYPQLGASLGASTGRTGASTAARESDSYTYSVSGTQLAFDGLKTFHDIKAAGENIQVAEQNYRFVSATIRYSLRSAFINVLSVQELIRVTDDIVTTRRDSLELITLQYYSGLEHRGALLTAEANLAQAEFERAQAQRSLEAYQRQLTKEMGRGHYASLQVKGDFDVRDAAKDKPDFENLAKNHPSLLEAAAHKNAAAFGIKSAYADFFPQASASASARKTTPTWPMQKEVDAWSMGLTVDVPLFEGGLRMAQVAKAKAQYLQSDADERSVRAGLVVALEEAWKTLRDDTEEVKVRQKSLDAAQERSRISEAQYSTGFITFDNWIIIENDLVLAKKAYLQAQASALQAEAAWIQAKGETLEYAP